MTKGIAVSAESKEKYIFQEDWLCLSQWVDGWYHRYAKNVAIVQKFTSISIKKMIFYMFSKTLKF